MTWELRGKTVLVTGGARGIGAACVRKFAAEGANVAINYLYSQGPSATLAEEVRKQHGIRAITVQGDMSKEEDARAVVRKTIVELGGIDVIVSNAGNTMFAPFSDIFALSSEDWTYAFDCLVKSNIFLLQEAQSTFILNPEGGCFLIMSSLAGMITDGSSLAYATCRAASIHLAKCLAQSQGPKIRVNAVCPGLTDTERIQGLPESMRQKYTDMAALKRITTAEDVADTFVFLAKAEGVTGETIRIDSGTSIR
ncbi:short chain dehydrogenase/reductase [Xylogone sp. PMI_703]|nr:short chain dehydrogenase/reductase [Xylogone sp. PMI_703]